MNTRVFVVEDSPIALRILTRIITSCPDFELVGTARDGKEALRHIPTAKPDVVCTDLYMSGMDGLELTQHLVALFRLPILVISVAVGEGYEANADKLLTAGAVDVIAKPATGLPEDYAKEELIRKIRIAAGVKVISRRSFTEMANTTVLQTDSPQIVAIGASTGGPGAVRAILAQLPHNFSLPIICTQHISEGFLDGLIRWLNQQCCLQVKVAENGEIPLPGKVYYAPHALNLEFDGAQRLLLTPALTAERYCPSINQMFRSASMAFGNHVIGILLSGMGDDGAEGLHCLSLNGSITVAQDEKSSIVFGMPKVAIDQGSVQHILPIGDIAKFLTSYQSGCISLQEVPQKLDD